jgi:hypothetical protein
MGARVRVKARNKRRETENGANDATRFVPPFQCLSALSVGYRRHPATRSNGATLHTRAGQKEGPHGGRVFFFWLQTNHL